MGYPKELAMASLRLSLSRYNTAGEVAAVIEILPKALKEARAKFG
jgi:cysteine sulfinate desulfinase/cysteine desulfurase-like protein